MIHQQQKSLLNFEIYMDSTTLLSNELFKSKRDERYGIHVFHKKNKILTSWNEFFIKN